jgi:hypothetical protein
MRVSKNSNSFPPQIYHNLQLWADNRIGKPQLTCLHFIRASVKNFARSFSSKMKPEDTPVHLTEEFTFGPIETRLNLFLHIVLVTVFVSLPICVDNGNATFVCHVVFTLFAVSSLTHSPQYSGDNFFSL